MKSPVYKINSMTTSATSINKVENFSCIAQAINHPSLSKKKKKGRGGHFSISWAFPAFLFFSVPWNITFSQFVYSYVLKNYVVLKMYVERSKPVQDLPLPDSEALFFHTIPVQW